MRCPAVRIAPFVLTLGVGCAGGTETGNPPFDAKLSYAAYSSHPDVVAIGSASARLDVLALWATVGELRFVVSGTCNLDPQTQSAPGLGTDDRAAPTPKTTHFEMVAGRYCEVDVPLEPAPANLPATAPAELAGNALMIEGRLPDGTTVSILGDAPPIALTPAASDFAMHPAEPNVLLAFDVATWLADLDFSGAVRDGSMVHVTRDQNAALFEQFQSRVARGVELFRDADGDGRVDPGTAPIATGH